VATKSSPKLYTQSQLTSIFADIVDKHPSQLPYILWNNPKDPNSLRLSLSGFNFVSKELKIQSYKFDISPPLTNRNVLQLDRYFNSMYFILPEKFVVFDEQEASMINLMDGNLVAYLNNLERSNG
jgi:hypothetical protein